MVEIALGIVAAYLIICFLPLVLMLGYYLFIGLLIGLGIWLLVLIPMHYVLLAILFGLLGWYFWLKTGH